MHSSCPCKGLGILDAEGVSIAVSDLSLSLLVHFIGQTETLILRLNGQFELQRRNEVLRLRTSDNAYLIHAIKKCNHGFVESMGENNGHFPEADQFALTEYPN